MQMFNQSQNLNYEQALIKATKYCAYQERYQQQVRQKLLELRVNKENIEAIICYLLEHNYLNEQRFASAYARGKLRIKHWGKQRIQSQLKFFGISDNCIKQALKELDQNEYLDILKLEFIRRIVHQNLGNNWMQIQDARQYLISRGFEGHSVDDQIKKHKEDEEKNKG